MHRVFAFCCVASFAVTAFAGAASAQECDPGIVRIDYGEGKKEAAQDVKAALKKAGISTKLTSEKHSRDANELRWDHNHRNFSECALGKVLMIIVRSKGRTFWDELGGPVNISESAFLVVVDGN